MHTVLVQAAAMHSAGLAYTTVLLRSQIHNVMLMNVQDVYSVRYSKVWSQQHEVTIIVMAASYVAILWQTHLLVQSHPDLLQDLPYYRRTHVNMKPVLCSRHSARVFSIWKHQLIQQLKRNDYAVATFGSKVLNCYLRLYKVQLSKKLCTP